MRRPLALSVVFDGQLVSQDFFLDFLARVERAQNIFLKTLSLKGSPLQSKESLYMLAPLVRAGRLAEVDLAALESDDDFVVELAEALRRDPANPLRYLSLGRVSSFACEFLARNVAHFARLHSLQFEESPRDRFSAEAKALLVANVRASRGELLFVKVALADASDAFALRLIELNEGLRRRKLEREEERVVCAEHANAVLTEISAADAVRLPQSFSAKNYLDSVFGDKLERAIFEVKNFQEKQRKHLQKLERRCVDEPSFAPDPHVFSADGFALLLCRKLVAKFGLRPPSADPQKENAP